MRCNLLLAACASVLIASAEGAAAMGAASGEYGLTVTGWCPGRHTFEWSGAIPNRRQGIVIAREQGTFIIPHGVCKGTVLGITNGVVLLAVISTRDGSGAVSGTGGQACGKSAQLIESGTCCTSNVARMP